MLGYFQSDTLQNFVLLLSNLYEQQIFMPVLLLNIQEANSLKVYILGRLNVILH